MILAIETSTPSASLALVDPARGEVLAEHSFSSDRAHNSAIFGPLREILDLLGDRSLQCIVVGTGPGSYSGVRVGIAVAIGLGLAKGCPLIGLPSLVTLAKDALVVGDARRQSFFTAEVRDQRLAAPPALWSEAAFLEHVAGTTLPVLTTDPAPPLGIAARIVHPAATGLARLAAALSPEEFAVLAATPVEPLYLRTPYITTPKTSFAATPGVPDSPA